MYITVYVCYMYTLVMLLHYNMQTMFNGIMYVYVYVYVYVSFFLSLSLLSCIVCMYMSVCLYVDMCGVYVCAFVCSRYVWCM